MHRYRPYSSSSASSSKATPTTRCQKCLKLGHYSFECKSTTHDRPYIPRPSRTQQLQNPKLLQKLTEAVLPDEPSLTTKKGIADGILKQKELDRERGRGARNRKRRRDGSGSPPPSGSRARSRSSSIDSFSSYSTLSSGRSPSPPAPSRGAAAADTHSHGRSGCRSESYSRSPDHERSVRRKYRGSPSPGRRGRQLSPTDFSRRTRSASKPRRRVSAPLRKPSRSPRRENYSNGGGNDIRRESSPLPPPRARSPSPFTRRRLMTEAIQRGR